MSLPLRREAPQSWTSSSASQLLTEALGPLTPAQLADLSLLISMATTGPDAERRTVSYVVDNLLVSFVGPDGRAIHSPRVVTIMERLNRVARSIPEDEDALPESSSFHDSRKNGVVSGGFLRGTALGERFPELLGSLIAADCERTGTKITPKLLDELLDALPTTQELDDARVVGFLAFHLYPSPTRVTQLNAYRIVRPNGSIRYKRRTPPAAQ